MPRDSINGLASSNARLWNAGSSSACWTRRKALETPSMPAMSRVGKPTPSNTCLILRRPSRSEAAISSLSSSTFAEPPLLRAALSAARKD
ncbi:hypothetical protein G6F60_015592 [Rhizopus arrhizus]|nr:hypothetical protein G6F60_015592 [Rhizopus arrhizus]